jgi:arabinofuranosyltransferase
MFSNILNMNRRWFALCLLLLILLGFVLNVTLYHYSRPYGKFLVINEDDAYISMRYAKNLAQGYGLLWNTDEQPVEGYTCFLWVLLLAVVEKLGGDMVLWSKILGTAFAGAGIVLVFSATNTLISERNFDYGGLLPAFILSFNPSYVYWAGSGMESALFICLLLLAIFLYVKKNGHATRYISLSIVFAFAALTRPEGLLFFGITCLHVCFWELFHRKGLSAKSLACLALPFLLIFIPYFGWRYNYYGYIFPNTFYAKMGGSTLGIVGGLRYLLKFLKGTPWIISLLLTVPLLRKRKFALSYMYALILPYVLYVVFVGGDWMFLSRFLLPILPCFAICLALLVIEFHTFIDAKRIPLTTKALLVGVLYLGIVYLNSRSLYTATYRKVEAINQQKSRLVGVGKYLRDAYPPQTTIAVLPAGAIPYYSGLKTIDMYGLSDTHIAHLETPKLGGLESYGANFPPIVGVIGHGKTDIPYVLARRPELLIGMPDLTSSADIPSKWDVEKLFRSYDRSEYELVVDEMKIPGDPFFERGIFFRYLRLKAFSETLGSLDGASEENGVDPNAQGE